ncbi:MAG: mannonate dehydratase, partial [Opitutaceae bacterium]
MKCCMLLPFAPDHRWHLARQCGVTHAVAKLAPELTGRNPPWDFAVLRAAKERFAAAGFTLCGLEGDQMDMSRIKLGLPGRDEDLELYRRMIANMGALGLDLLCYNFMAGIGWYRTSFNVAERGGAVTNAFDAGQVSGATEHGTISAEAIWSNYLYFLRGVLPGAEAAGVALAIHPDDPPVKELKGIARIFSDAEGFRRSFREVKSPAHQLTFCQANFHLMGEDVPALIGEFGRQGKIA